MNTVIPRKIKIFIFDRNYSQWSFVDVDNNNVEITVDEFPALSQIRPLESKLFSRDIVTFDSATNAFQTVLSYIKTCGPIAGVLVLENNKTYGRTANGKRLLYKCVPDDIHLPVFLVPYELRIGFSKTYKNKYVTFSYASWTSTHPYGQLTSTIGDVDNVEAFYEYQLYCKSLHVSITDFTNRATSVINHATYEDHVQQILANPAFDIEDRRDAYIFTIDPKNSQDYDDGFSIRPVPLENGGTGHCVSIYIANVFVWLETFGLWESFSKRVATIYLPDRRRPMLPSILSDALCSLQEGKPRFALVMDVIIDPATNQPVSVCYRNVLINVSKNYAYEDKPMVHADSKYKQLLDLTARLDASVKNSHDLVSYWMVYMNAYTGAQMAAAKLGIFRASAFICTPTQLPLENVSDDVARVIRGWNNTMGQYIAFSEGAVLTHEMMNIKSIRLERRMDKHPPNPVDQPKDTIPQTSMESKMMKSYIHITSPIRRLVDLLNQMMLFQHLSLVSSFSPAATRFVEDWIDQMEYINTSMRSIRKVQTECELLHRCTRQPDLMEKIHRGVVFDKIHKNDGTFSYMVYLEELKLLSRVITQTEIENYAFVDIRLYLFHDEDKLKRKIRVAIL
jgi:exoribonuclease R